MIENASPVGKSIGDKEIEIEEGSKYSGNGSPFPGQKKMDMELEGEKKQQMPPASVMTRLILIMVWRKLIRNPNTYSSLLGLIWSLVSFRSTSFSFFYQLIEMFLHILMYEIIKTI